MVTASMLSVFGIVLVRRIRRQIVQTIDAADSRLGQIGAILDRIESRG